MQYEGACKSYIYLKIIKDADTVYLHGLLEMCTRVTTLTTCDTDTAKCIGRMVATTRACGKEVIFVFLSLFFIISKC
jgi:hypothetical protein